MKSLLGLNWFHITWLTTTEGVSMIFSHCGGIESQAAQKMQTLTLLAANSGV